MPDTSVAPTVQSPRRVPSSGSGLAARFRCPDIEALLDRKLRAPATPTGLVGFELEALAGLSEHITRGTIVAGLPYGQTEVDNSRSGTRLQSLYEAISDAGPGPTAVHTFGLGATEFLLRLHEQVRDNPDGDTQPTSFWPAAHVSRDVKLRDVRRIRNAVIVGMHTSSGCSHEPHLLLELLKRAAPAEAARAATDVGVLLQQHWDVARQLSPQGLSLLNLIACAVRSAEVPCRNCTPHMFFPVMSRGTFSGYFSALSESDREHLAQLLLPDDADGRSPLMRAAGLRPGDRLFGSPYVVGVWVTDADGRRVREVREHDGPTACDWFISIVDPQRFGRDTDLISPPEGCELPGMKKEGMGDMPDAKGYILELRTFAPDMFPATGICVVLMLQYKFLQRVNPNLQKVDFVDGGEEEEANIRRFSDIGWLCSDLVELSEALHERQPLTEERLDTLWRRLATRDCIEAHAQDEQLPALLDELGHCIQGPPDAQDHEGRARFCEVAEAVTRRLSDAYPRIGEALFGEDLRRWEAAARSTPAAPTAKRKRQPPPPVARRDFNLRPDRRQSSASAVQQRVASQASTGRPAPKRRRVDG